MSDFCKTLYILFVLFMNFQELFQPDEFHILPLYLILHNETPNSFIFYLIFISIFDESVWKHY